MPVQVAVGPSCTMKTPARVAGQWRVCQCGRCALMWTGRSIALSLRAEPKSNYLELMLAPRFCTPNAVMMPVK